MAALLAWFASRHGRVALFYCYAYFLLGIIVASIGPVLPELSRRTNVTLNEGGIGVITTSRSLGYLVGSIGSGVLVEKRAQWGNGIISGSLLCAGAGMVAMTLTNSFLLVCFILAFTGFAMGALDVAANVLIVGEFERPVEAEPYMQALHASFAIGACVAPIFTTHLMVNSWDGRSFNLPFWIAGICCLPGVVAGLALQLCMKQTARSEGATAVTRTELTNKQRFLLIACCGSILMLYVGAEVAVGFYVFTYARFVPFFDEIPAGFVNTVFWATFTFGRVSSVFMSAAKIGPRVMLWTSLLATCFFSLFVVAFPRSAWSLWVAAAGIGLAMAPTFPTVFNFASTYMPVTGRVASALVICASFGEMLVPLCIGVLFSVPWAGYEALFPAVAVCAFVGLLLALGALVVVRGVPVLQHHEPQVQMLTSEFDSELERDDNELDDLL